MAAQLIKEKYHPDSTFLDAQLGKRPSYVWRGIWGAKDLLEEGLMWKVGNGRNIRI